MVKLIAVYLVFSLPFSAMVLIPGLTNLRPATALIPLYGIFFGPAGAWAYAIGNVLYDFLSGNLVISSIGGFIGNFVAAGLFWALSRKLMTKEGVFVGSVGTVIAYQLVSVAACLTVAGAVMFFVAGYLPEVNATDVGLSIFVNDLFFMLVPSMALCILMSTAMKMQPAVLRSVR